MCPIGFLMLGSTPARPAERFARRKPISPAGRLPTSSRNPRPARQRRRTGAAHRYPLTHPPTLVRRPIGGGKQASAPEPLVDPRTQPWTVQWAPRGPRHGMPDMPAVRLAAPSARVRTPDTRLDTVSARSVPPADTRQWLAGRGTWRIARPSGRPDTPVQGDRPADGSGPGPDGGGQAADTFSVQRPTMRLASWPRPTMRPAHPGHDRTGRQCACSPSANPSRAGTSASLVPVRCPRGRVRRPRWTP
jgi:hypothetical protein